MSTQKGQCPICDDEATIFRYDAGGEVYRWECPNCGKFESRILGGISLEPNEKAMLAAFMRERHAQGATVTSIFEDSVPRTFTAGHGVSLQDALEYMRDVFASPTERMNRTLIGIKRASNGLGRSVCVNRPSMAYAEDDFALRFILGSLKDEGYITLTPSTAGFQTTLTAAGYNRIAEIQSEKRGIDSDQAFVAMSFAASMNELYDKGISPAIEGAGYKPKRIDENVAPVKICDDIILEIRRSRFIVADVTEQRQGVYFEAGFALGLGLPVIWTVKEDNVDKLNFDTRQYRHIVWKTPEGLKQELQARIEANIPRL